MNKTIKFIISVLGAELIGSIGVIFTFPNIESWYAALNKASFNPPNWLFGPAWTILFFLMGWAFYKIWTSFAKNKTNAYWAFGVQFVLNVLWSAIFFGQHSLRLGFIEIIVMWIAILWTIIEFYKINKMAGYLLFPYLIWVTFGSILNYYALILN